MHPFLTLCDGFSVGCHTHTIYAPVIDGMSGISEISDPDSLDAPLSPLPSRRGLKVVIPTTHVLSPNRLYERSMQSIEAKQRRVREMERSRLRDCTFTPETNKQKKVRPKLRSRDGTVFDRLYRQASGRKLDVEDTGPTEPRSHTHTTPLKSAPTTPTSISSRSNRIEQLYRHGLDKIKKKVSLSDVVGRDDNKTLLTQNTSVTLSTTSTSTTQSTEPTRSHHRRKEPEILIKRRSKDYYYRRSMQSSSASASSTASDLYACNSNASSSPTSRLTRRATEELKSPRSLRRADGSFRRRSRNAVGTPPRRSVNSPSNSSINNNNSREGLSSSYRRPYKKDEYDNLLDELLSDETPQQDQQQPQPYTSVPMTTPRRTVSVPW